MPDIPDFEGQTVDGTRLNFSGAVDNFDRPVHVDEELTIVVKGRVKAVNHKETQFGVLLRQQSFKVAHATVAPPDAAETLAQVIKRREDDAVGQESLDDDIDAVVEGDE